MMPAVLIVLMLLGLVIVPCFIGHYIRSLLNAIASRHAEEPLTHR
ncbi:hypothetical protein HDF17_003528 [Granulicella arctica]|uniref:Uncharacterized protein n=1 Tax=Granulicella arctica TaxID=940613 RepID=A0A7Y9TUW8_9BACT|nr:hypothetical protein [Granulicella arctica]